MYPNSCMYLQSWNSHLVEMDYLPLSCISKSFRGYKGHDKIWERTNTRSHSQAGDEQSSLGLTWNGQAWLGRAARDATATLAQQPLLLPVILMAWNWDPPMGTYTQMITVPAKEPHSNHFDLSVAQHPPHCFTLATANSGRCNVRDPYGMVEAPPMHNSDKISHVEFFVIPVCR